MCRLQKQQILIRKRKICFDRNRVVVGKKLHFQVRIKPSVVNPLTVAYNRSSMPTLILQTVDMLILICINMYIDMRTLKWREVSLILLTLFSHLTLSGIPSHFYICRTEAVFGLQLEYQYSEVLCIKCSALCFIFSWLHLFQNFPSILIST